MQKENICDFLHIGLAKCGSTFLQKSVLDSHPDIQLVYDGFIPIAEKIMRGGGGYQLQTSEIRKEIMDLLESYRQKEPIDNKRKIVIGTCSVF